MKKVIFLYTLLLFCFSLNAQPGTVGSFTKISNTSGNFTGQLNNNDQFGRNLVNIGDLNGDGIEDLAVGANLDDDGGTDRGAVWILFMNTNGTVNSHQKISIGNGGFTGFPTKVFGTSIGLIGDLNGDGVQDLVVGETDSNDGAFQAGAVWILFMNTNGTVNAHQKISSTSGNLNTTLNVNGRFGSDVAGIGDIDNDGIPDIAVSQQFSNLGGSQVGAVWILRLNANGTVKAKQEIGAGTGGFTGTLNANDNFGSALAGIGDFDNDGINNILVGARRDDDGGTDKGAIWLIYLNANGTVKNNLKISDTQGNFTGSLTTNDRFGIAAESLGDLDGDNISDFAVGACFDDDGGTDRGAIWILFMNANGTVKAHQKISDTQGNFAGQLDNSDYFGGWAISLFNDLNNDGIKDLAVCAVGDDDGGISKGAVWVLFLDCNSAIPSNLSVNLGNDTTLCANSTLQLNATNNQATNYLWQDGSTNSTYTVTQAGNYIITISDACYSYSDTINIQYYNSQLTANLGADTILCTGETLSLNVTNPTAINYLWQDGSTNPTFEVTQSGIYFVTIEDSCNIISDTINVQYNTSPISIDLGNDTTICANSTLQLNATNGQATNYLWQDGSTNSTYTVTQAGNYIITISDACYSYSDTINIQYYNSQLTANLGADTILCTSETLSLNVTNPTAINYLWQDGSTNPTFEVTQSGTYFVTIEDSCNIVSDTINVIITDDSPTLDLGDNMEICIGETAIIDATTIDANTYLWNTGATTPSIEVNTEGQYSIDATNDCGTSTDSIYVNFIDCNCYVIVPNAFSPQSNQNTTFYPMTEGICNFTNYKFMIYNRWGNLVFETNNVNMQWNGIYNNELQIQDTYTWIIDYELDSGAKEILKGTVLLVR